MFTNSLPQLLDALTLADKDALLELGKQIGKLYTDHGLPVDMAFDRLDMNSEKKIVVLTGALNWLVEHKRNSGAPEKAIERQRKLNTRMMGHFMQTGEVGLY